MGLGGILGVWLLTFPALVMLPWVGTLIRRRAPLFNRSGSTDDIGQIRPGNG